MKALAALLGLPALVAAETPRPVDALAGAWTVDLRTAPTEPAYTQPMQLAIGADGLVTGRFYNSRIEDGRASTSNGRTCLAFRTWDGRTPYQTSGCVLDGRIVGQTWSEGRRFILAWTAERTR